MSKIKFWEHSQVCKGTLHRDIKVRIWSNHLCAPVFLGLVILRRIFIATSVTYKGPTSKPTDIRTS